MVATNYLTPENMRSGSAGVIISVGDVNDERPVFLQPSYSATLPEGTPVGSLVFIVTAQDDDLENVS